MLCNNPTNAKGRCLFISELGSSPHPLCKFRLKDSVFVQCNNPLTQISDGRKKAPGGICPEWKQHRKNSLLLFVFVPFVYGSGVGYGVISSINKILFHIVVDGMMHTQLV